MTIDTRTAELMCEHKETLARALATVEAADGREFSVLVSDAEDHLAAQENTEQLNVASDPVVTEVPPAPAEPEALDVQTLEPVEPPPAPPVDNDHVAAGAEQFAPDVVEGADAAPAAEKAPEPEGEPKESTETPAAEPGEQLP